MAKKNSFDPEDRAFPFSRTALELFKECPRCFYFDRRLHTGRPSGPSFVLNVAVDTLLKKEFDAYRARGEQHPVMSELPGDLVPFDHPSMADWRSSRHGIRLVHAASGLELYGAPDDIWLSRVDGSLHIVDYKATSSSKAPTLDTEHRLSWKRQLDIYAYLLEGNGFPVSETAYFLLENAAKTPDAFDGLLRFAPTVMEYRVDTSWIDGSLVEARACLEGDAPPAPGDACEWCAWAAAVTTGDGGAA